jgi:hypothetical protein
MKLAFYGQAFIPFPGKTPRLILISAVAVIAVRAPGLASAVSLCASQKYQAIDVILLESRTMVQTVARKVFPRVIVGRFCAGVIRADFVH